MGFLKDFIGQAATQLKQASPVQAGAARVERLLQNAIEEHTR